MAKILVVDDELDFCEYLGKILSREGYSVINATSGQEALDKIQTEKPDLVLLDFLMPKMDGIETLEKIKQIDKDIIVIMVTIVNDAKVAEKAIKLGAINYITKPINLDLLKRNIKSWAIWIESNQLSKIDTVVLDYDQRSYEAILAVFSKKGYKIVNIENKSDKLQLKGPLDLLIIRADIIKEESINVLSKYKQAYPQLQAIITTEPKSANTLIDKIKQFGSCHYLPSSFGSYGIILLIYKMLSKSKDKTKRSEEKFERKIEEGKLTDYILIVDDEHDICEYISRYLSREGYNVNFVTDAKDVLEQVTTLKPSIVLLDIVMPGVDGLELLNNIKKIEPQIQVIMMTGVKDESIMRESIESGACDYLLKPFSLEQLKATVFTNAIKSHLN